ncbi:Aste57867_4072 [Aphanomyces stellatus]|uniref:Aste57867_4072 protein n=1 Tax=Aphanomyces stellatus TaxID=120398 RepID=A0A485KCJ1_9STRA|nr:hypothetical protein As57867_004061 [Aphanomyces stellatus]VFT81206.1 Aste57867_4072 [Aphanomyces stellatus]
MEASRALQWMVLLQKLDGRQFEATWMYPNVPADQLQVLLFRVNVDRPHHTADPYFLKFQDTWVYVSPPTTGSLIAVSSKCFDPEKYATLLRLLVDEYVQPPSTPLALLRVYLALYTTGQYSNPLQTQATFVWNKNQEMAPYIAGLSLADFVAKFQDDSAIVWLAILAKKRVVVSSDSFHELLQITRCLPQFAWHRQDWSILRPFTRLSSLEVTDLHAAGVYIAGVLSSDSHDAPFDVLLDVPHRRVVVHDSCAALFSGLEWHKECTDFIKRSPTLEAIGKKTSAMIDTLKTSALTSLDAIQDPLKWSLAVAEELV